MYLPIGIVSVPFSSGFLLQREMDAEKIEKVVSFSSLFIGIPFATLSRLYHSSNLSARFQFPFHRDSFCNRNERVGQVVDRRWFQFPFHRDSFCNPLVAPQPVAPQPGFSSLFIGIPFATSRVALPRVILHLGFSSLFIGIPFATMAGAQSREQTA